jgi:hypothetical protein
MLSIDDTSKTALLLLVGAAIFELGREMRECGPDLSELRQADDSNRHELKQMLIDGNVHTAILVTGVSIISIWATGSLTPALILILVFLGLLWCHHDLLKAPAVTN